MQRFRDPAGMHGAAGNIDDGKAGARAEIGAEKPARLLSLEAKPTSLCDIVARRRHPAIGGAGADGEYVACGFCDIRNYSHHRNAASRLKMKAARAARAAQNRAFDAENIERIAAAQPLKKRAESSPPVSLSEGCDNTSIRARSSVRNRSGASAPRRDMVQPPHPPDCSHSNVSFSGLAGSNGIMLCWLSQD